MEYWHEIAILSTIYKTITSKMIYYKVLFNVKLRIVASLLSCANYKWEIPNSDMHLILFLLNQNHIFKAEKHKT